MSKSIFFVLRLDDTWSRICQQLFMFPGATGNISAPWTLRIWRFINLFIIIIYYYIMLLTVNNKTRSDRDLESMRNGKFILQ